MKRYFLTGTDTDVGKTLITSALLNKAKLEGLTSFGLKPIASGSHWVENTSKNKKELRNNDALLHQKYSYPGLAYEIHNPITLEAAIAPHIAAKQAGIELSVNSLINICEPGLRKKYDLQIIEGAGGWLVPLNPKETLADFAKALNCPVILVVGMQLGCINHACLTADKILQDGLTISGWVANHIDPNMNAQNDNLNYLNHWFNNKNIPNLGKVSYMSGLDPFKEEDIGKISDILKIP